MTTATSNGADLYYETTGIGERLVLTHGSWTDASGWAPAIPALSERFEVVTWDRRGHSRSRSTEHAGSRDEDAADLAALIEHLGGGPVHVAGNSYGSIIVLTLVADRPDLVASAAVHEPPLLALLEGTTDPGTQDALDDIERQLDVVVQMIDTGGHRAAAEHFVDHVALGPGQWGQLPEQMRAVLEANAATFADERRDPTSSSVDTAALAAASVPLLLTHGSASPPWYAAIIAELTRLVPASRVALLDEAGHIPHATHPDRWVASLVDFHHAECGTSS